MIEVKVEIMTDLLVRILSCTDKEAEEIIKNSETYYWLEEKDFATLYDSPQANLSSIGEELRQKNDPIGLLVTDENIRKAMLSMCKDNKQLSNILST